MIWRKKEEQFWKSIEYAERLPIGLEKVIRTVSPGTVKQFYRKWYHLKNMVVVAIGDFADTQSAVMVSCKMPVVELRTVRDYRELLVECMFFLALNQRFFKISRKKDLPYFSCSASADVLVRPSKAYIMTSSCKEKGTIEALESMLTEVARVRLHGFSEREIAIARALLLLEIESSYLERDQMQSTSLRDEYLQHFLHDEPVIAVEYEAQLHKTILPRVHMRGGLMPSGVHTRGGLRCPHARWAHVTSREMGSGESTRAGLGCPHAGWAHKPTSYENRGNIVVLEEKGGAGRDFRADTVIPTITGRNVDMPRDCRKRVEPVEIYVTNWLEARLYRGLGLHGLENPNPSLRDLFPKNYVRLDPYK
ncbi:hypothetical protein AgCh_012721 [Apium graveolens]